MEQQTATHQDAVSSSGSRLGARVCWTVSMDTGQQGAPGIRIVRGLLGEGTVRD